MIKLSADLVFHRQGLRSYYWDKIVFKFPQTENKDQDF